ncbi:carbon-nitrogen hydrolase family protein [Aeromonas caviae]|uniref:carbon-nitrogen hydrolase family protein n=1 Tax=Aeromonas caviae TaxID=648 RepID=UPI00244BC6EF|nr:carbon-nitrogen hydrolase family protein [Aeromonas caviae]MDH0138056.1 carbon-nitrogen hydrolase family protein [Aeromonas caviae]
MDSLRVAVLQMVSGDDLDHNLAQAEALLRQAAAEGAELALLPEYFYLMPVDERARVALAAPVGNHPLLAWVQGLARELGVWILAGTLPLASHEPGKMHNSSLLIDPQGQLASRYDKLHLFGFCTGQEQYDEAATMTPGREVVSHPLPWGVLRLGICYDLRFPELFRLGPAPDFIALPAAFTHTTGLAHWTLLLRARAVENLAFVFASAQGGHHPGGRRTFGHSMIIDPWGRILAQVEEGQGLAIATLDLAAQRTVRSQLPALTHRKIAVGP